MRKSGGYEPDDGSFIKDALACVKLNTKYRDLLPTLVAKSEYGKFYAVCTTAEKTEADCKTRLVKILNLTKEQNKRDSEREVFIYRQLNGTGLTPNLYETFSCGDYFYMVMDRFNADMQSTSREQAKKFGGAAHYLYTEKQFRKMFEIAYLVGAKYNVIHGDLKPDQYLINHKDGRIVLIDFGFSGQQASKWHAKHGWSWAQDYCAYFAPIPPEPVSDVYAEVFYSLYNVYQLWSWFAYSRALTLVRRDNGKYEYVAHGKNFFTAKSPMHLPQTAIHFFQTDELKDCPASIKWPSENPAITEVAQNAGFRPLQLD